MPNRVRRHRGEGSIYRLCSKAAGCPDPVEMPGQARKLRPPHDCRARYAQAIDLGMVGGKRERKVVTARTKRELTVKADELRKKLALGVSPTAQNVGDWLDYWLTTVAPASGIRPTTLKGYRSKIDRYLKPGIGHIKLQDLTAEHVEALHRWMRTLDKSRYPGGGSGPLSETTIRQAHMILRSALTEALLRGKVVRNVAAVVTAPKADQNPHEHLGLDDAKAVLASAQTERELCRLVCALVLGLRQGEALGLRWQDVIMGEAQSYVMIAQAVQRVGGRLVRTDVKSKASHRAVPLPDAVALIFRAWHEVASDEYVFPGSSGGPCDAKADWTAWREALARAGVPAVPLHGARGSAASLLAAMNVPDWMIAEILGHSQVIVTRKHYIKGTDEGHMQAIAGLGAELLP